MKTPTATLIAIATFLLSIGGTMAAPASVAAVEVRDTIQHCPEGVVHCLPVKN